MAIHQAGWWVEKTRNDLRAGERFVVGIVEPDKIGRAEYEVSPATRELSEAEVIAVLKEHEGFQVSDAEIAFGFARAREHFARR
jgi:hypothetical protein